ncbi:MAG TPA: LemA family protein [bacterium]|jgi:LemA protein|nr:LemA family protein [bacterium]
MSATGYVITLVVILLLWFVLLYNGLVKWRNTVQSAWAQIDVQLKRRYDLIPNLVDTVRAYAKHERELFETIARVRAEALTAGNPRDVAGAEMRLAPAIRSLFAVAEAYPQLKADQNFRDLMEELTATENKVAFARQYYNDSVRVYNTKIQQFPAALIAGPLHFLPADYLEVDAVQREVQQVKF